MRMQGIKAWACMLSLNSRSNRQHLLAIFETHQVKKGLDTANCLSLSFSLIIRDWINRENNKQIKGKIQENEIIWWEFRWELKRDIKTMSLSC